MDPTTPAFWDNALRNGPMWCVAAVLAWLIWNHGPAVVKAHVNYVTTSAGVQQQQAATLSQLTEANTTELTQNVRTHRILGHHADALQKLAGELGHGDAVEVHIREIKRLVDER